MTQSAGSSMSDNKEIVTISCHGSNPKLFTNKIHEMYDANSSQWEFMLIKQISYRGLQNTYIYVLPAENLWTALTLRTLKAFKIQWALWSQIRKHRVRNASKHWRFLGEKWNWFLVHAIPSVVYKFCTIYSYFLSYIQRHDTSRNLKGISCRMVFSTVCHQ